MWSNKSREEKSFCHSSFFWADSSAANSQNRGCVELVLVWASRVAGFSKMVSTPIVLQIPGCVGGPPNRRPEKGLKGGWTKTPREWGYLGKFWKTIGTIVMLSKNLQWTKQASFPVFLRVVQQSFLLHFGPSFHPFGVARGFKSSHLWHGVGANLEDHPAWKSS